MLSIIAVIAFCLMASLPAAAVARGAADSEATPGRAITRAPGLLSKAGVNSPSCIGAVVIHTGYATYKATRAGEPQFVERMYHALERARNMGVFKITSPITLMLKLTDGKGLWFMVSEPPSASSTAALLTGGYSAPSLPSLLREIANNAQAAALDARVGDLEIYQIQLRTPHSREIRWVPPGSTEGRALAQKAGQIVDCVDLRWAHAEVVRSRDISDAALKFGFVEMLIKTAIQLEVMVWDKATEPRGFPDPVAYNVSFKKFWCDRIAVLDYGNYRPPLVALRDRDAADAYYLCTHLTRRDQEKYGVEKLGFPGHPVTDTEYYKSPKVLYEELQELTKVAYEKWEGKPMRTGP